MANVKGIIVEIGGDTSKLQEALKKVNSSTASLSKELRGINSLLKLDPKNTELVSQKQTILKKEIEETENKLKLLHSTYQRAVEAEVDGAKISEENWRKIQREIIATENKLKQLQLENSKWTQAGRSIEEFGNKITNISSKVDKLGTTLTTRLTLPIFGISTMLVNSSKEFETAFIGVEKTVDGTATQMANLKQGIKDMAEVIPASTTEISAVAEAAGQLGIQTDNVLDFTKTMINMGNATNLSADEAATTLARFANVTKMSQKDFDKLGSVIVALGNNFQTTEAEIVQMGMNLGSAGTQVGMSQSQIMALATALSSVGLEAQAGGTAFSKVMVNMQLAVEKGGKNLKDFASVAGMSAKDFQKAFKDDATGAIMKFVEGLSKSGERGKSAIKVLDDMGITETRLRDALLRSANASEVMSKAIDLGNQAWEENTALTKEADKRYQSLDSRLEMTKSKIKNVATNTGDKLTPTFNRLLNKVDGLIDKFDDLNEEEITNIIRTAGIVAAVGPAIKILGTLGKGIGTTVKSVGTLSQAIGVMKTGMESTNTSANTLAKGLSVITNPAFLVATAITVTTGIIVTEMKKAEKETTEKVESMANGFNNFFEGVKNAEGYLDSFNTTLFATAEEQQELQNQMNEIQEGITKICKTASDERREYTQEEITQLDEYFNKLRELKNREIEIEQSRADAVKQQAITIAETNQGTLAEYKEVSEQWISTIQKQTDKTISIIENGTIEEVALLNQRYKTEEERQSEAYQIEYNNLMARKQEKIALANEEVAQVTSAFSDGYSIRLSQEDGYLNTIKEYTEKQQKLLEGHNEQIRKIKDGELWYVTNTADAIKSENETFAFHQKEIYQEMYKNISKEQADELGVWMARLSQTELYGGKVSEENKKMVENIIASYDSMPEDAQTTMKQTMEGMLKGMQDKEPSLYAKATGIAGNILNKLNKAFDIHSPSKATRKIFKYVMQGAELGLDDEKNKLNNQIDKITQQMKDKFNLIMPNMGDIKQSIIDKTQTIFTTPQIVFNVQELDEAKLQQCFNYINKKFGSAY